MIDTEHVKCDTCTAPEPMELDASDEASRGWPTIDIETNPYKAQFPLFQQHPEIAFLDSAATAQRPACVLDAERDFYQRMNANPLRGLYSLSVEATDAIAKVRQQIADLIGAAQANEVVFTRNTSESLNLVAKSFAPTVLEPGDEVVITIMEHHSNLIPWQQVCRETGAKLVYLYPTKTGQLTTEEVLAKVGPKTKILAVGQVSNVLGVENPVKNLGKLVHKYGGYLVVDGAQSLPHMPVDVADLGADFFAFSAHKAMGPMGIGVLWGKMDLFNAMPPFNHRDPGVVGAASDDAAHVEMISDGIHLHPAVVRSVFRWFGAERVCLISDSMRAAGMPNGVYSLGGQTVYMTDGKATLEDGTIAGSATCLAECFRRAVSFGVPLDAALRAATINPAQAVGLFDELGSITAGKRADILVLDETLHPEKIFIGGVQTK